MMLTLKMVFYWIRQNLTYIGNRGNYSDYVGIMSESSLAALLSLKESAATIKCIAKQTRTVTNYPKESEGVERPFCHCPVIVQTLIIRLAEDSLGRWGIPVLSGNQMEPWHKDSVEGSYRILLKPKTNAVSRMLQLDQGPSGRGKSSSPARTVWCCAVCWLAVPNNKQLHADIVC